MSIDGIPLRLFLPISKDSIFLLSLQLTEKLLDAENEAMAKIVELEKQLMHTNKDLEGMKV